MVTLFSLFLIRTCLISTNLIDKENRGRSVRKEPYQNENETVCSPLFVNGVYLFNVYILLSAVKGNAISVEGFEPRNFGKFFECRN